MVIGLKAALTHLPLPSTPTWPENVWDKTVFEHGTMSVIRVDDRFAGCR